MKNKLLATAYINLIQDSKGETQFEYGYDLDKVNISLNDVGMFLSFLDTLQNKAEQDFKDRLRCAGKEIWGYERLNFLFLLSPLNATM